MNRLTTLVALFVLFSARIAAADPIVLSASIAPLAAIAREVGGEDVAVGVVLPPGADPHTFEPGPRMAKTLAAAEAHFVIGLGLDGWAERLAAAANREAPIDRLCGGAEDPHVWLDPVQAAGIAERIGERLALLRPEKAEHFRQRADGVRRRYLALADSCDRRLANVRNVPFLADHGGLTHWVRRFGLRQVGVLELFPGSEPSPKHLSRLVDTVKETGARAIFTEQVTSSRLARVLARETGATIHPLDLLGGTVGRESYEALILAIVDTMSVALGRSVED